MNSYQIDYCRLSNVYTLSLESWLVCRHTDEAGKTRSKLQKCRQPCEGAWLQTNVIFLARVCMRAYNCACVNARVTKKQKRAHTKMNLVGGPPAAVTTILLLLIFINCIRVKGEKSNPFISLTDTPPSSSFSPLSSSPVFPVFTRVLNAFPPSGAHGSHVTVVLDEDRIEGVGYGRVSEKETMMRAVEDFVIDFKSPTTGGS